MPPLQRAPLTHMFLGQVLGGAGPAIAAVPLTVVWVGGSFVTLLTGISAGKVGPVGAAQRVGYVFFMSVAQVRVCSRCLLLLQGPSLPATRLNPHMAQAARGGFLCSGKAAGTAFMWLWSYPRLLRLQLSPSVSTWSGSSQLCLSCCRWWAACPGSGSRS